MSTIGVLSLRKRMQAFGFQIVRRRKDFSTEYTTTNDKLRVEHDKCRTQSRNEANKDYDKSIKLKILSASVPFVDKFGWSQEAISAGAESISYPGVVHGLFPNGGVELVYHFYSSCNAKLREHLQGKLSTNKEEPPEKFDTGTSERIVVDALEARLRMIVPYKKTWPQALGLMALPYNAKMSLTNLFALVDDVCYYSGDRSVDFDWYAKRMTVAGIYETTELYLLQDTSENHKNTWQFLQRRIKDVSNVQTILSQVPTPPPPDQAIDVLTGALTTARNVFGLNWKKQDQIKERVNGGYHDTC